MRTVNLPVSSHSSLEFSQVKLAVSILVKVPEDGPQFGKSKLSLLPECMLKLEIQLLNSNLYVDAKVSHF